jgi:predicted nuclease of predicted toxin-antitoxin system
MAQNYGLKDIPTLGRWSVVIADANVLIFMYWAKTNQTDVAWQYKQAFTQLQQCGVSLVTTMGVLSEVTNRVFKEQWQAWNIRRRKQGRMPINDFKLFRDSPTGVAMMDEINKIVNNRILKQVDIVEKQFTNTEAAALFVTNRMDLTDRIIAAIADERGYIVFTHDGDFRHSTVDILTDNGKILKAQRGSPQQVATAMSNAPPPV